MGMRECTAEPDLTNNTKIPATSKRFELHVSRITTVDDAGEMTSSRPSVELCQLSDWCKNLLCTVKMLRSGLLARSERI